MILEHSNINALIAMAEARGEYEYAELLADFEKPELVTPNRFQSFIGFVNRLRVPFKLN